MEDNERTDDDQSQESPPEPAEPEPEQDRERPDDDYDVIINREEDPGRIWAGDEPEELGDEC